MFKPRLGKHYLIVLFLFAAIFIQYKFDPIDQIKVHFGTSSKGCNYNGRYYPAGAVIKEWCKPAGTEGITCSKDGSGRVSNITCCIG